MSNTMHIKGKVGYRVYSYIRGSIEADEGVFASPNPQEIHMYDTANTANLEAAVLLYLEQQHNYELWLAGEEAAEALDAITSEAA